MNDYTPTTDEVRGYQPWPVGFDLWLTSYTAKVQADALREAAAQWQQDAVDQLAYMGRHPFSAFLLARADSLDPTATSDRDETGEVTA